MRVVIAGASGFIGRALVTSLLERGDKIFVLTRRSEKAASILPNGVTILDWSPPLIDEAWAGEVGQADAVVNLAGEPIAEKKWTDRQKERILASRVDSTNAVVEALGSFTQRPSVLVNGSAIGYYGSRGDIPLAETSEAGDDFLAGVCRQWETAAERATELGLRVVRVRTGIVLGRDGGALPRLALPFKLFGGGLMGPRKQWVSWVHLDDEVGIIKLALDSPQATGSINSVSPSPVTMEGLSHAIGHVLHRPVWAPGLPTVMRIALGERSEVVFASQKVAPERAEQLGYRFRYPKLEEALSSALS